MSNVHVILDEDTNGDLVDIEYFHHACAPSGAKEWPAPESIDYPVYCGSCGERVEEVPLSDYGIANCQNDNHSDYRDQQDAPDPSWSAVRCPDCGITYIGVPEDERGPVPAPDNRLDLSENSSNMMFLDADDEPEGRWFPWDDDVIIRFWPDDQGQRIVSADSAITMIRSIIWTYDHPEVSGGWTPEGVIGDILSLLANAGATPNLAGPKDYTFITLPDYGIPECREDGTDL